MGGCKHPLLVSYPQWTPLSAQMKVRRWQRLVAPRCCLSTPPPPQPPHGWSLGEPFWDPGMGMGCLQLSPPPAPKPPGILQLVFLDRPQPPPPPPAGPAARVPLPPPAWPRKRTHSLRDKEALLPQHRCPNSVRLCPGWGGGPWGRSPNSTGGGTNQGTQSWTLIYPHTPCRRLDLVGMARPSPSVTVSWPMTVPPSRAIHSKERAH